MSAGIAKRSRWVALIGLPIVVIAILAIALPHSNEARPSGAILGICAVIFGFVAILIYAQRQDLHDARAADLRAAALAGPAAITDPTQIGAHQVMASLSLRPAGTEQDVARDSAWDLAESSWRSSAIVCAMIPFAVVPWIAFGMIWPILIGSIVIGGFALVLSVRLVIPGGGIDRGFTASEAALGPLGLTAVERPTLELTPRLAQPGFDPGMRGAHVLRGERHGRTVTVIRSGGSVQTVVETPMPEFEIKAKGERLKAVGQIPAAAAEVIDSLRASSYWQGVSLVAGADGIAVSRKRDQAHGWLCDIWLAESLADGSAPAGA